MATCKTCSGKGSVKCPKCNGKGRVDAGMFSGMKECPNCYGSGVKKCGACNGKGHVQLKKGDAESQTNKVFKDWESDESAMRPF